MATSKAESQKRYRERYPDRVRESRTRAIADRRAYVNEIKKNPCVDCGGRFPTVCMDFDHREDTGKRWIRRSSISQMVNVGLSISSIQAEIDKCDLVCANCHRIRTARKSGWVINNTVVNE